MNPLERFAPGGAKNGKRSFLQITHNLFYVKQRKPISRLALWPWLAGAMIFASQNPRAGAAEPAGVAQFHQSVQPILEQYCYECHGDGMSNGGVAFDGLKSGDEILNHDLWSKVMKNLRTGIMPPQKAPHPGAADRKVLEDWVKYEAFGIDPKNPDPGRVTLRRLNRVEYHNTIRDLMGVDYNTDEEFPPDDTGYGFDNIGDVLTLSPMLLEKYMIAATAIVEEAVPKVSRVIPQTTLAGSRFRPVGTNADNADRGGRRGQGARAGNRGGNQRDTLLSLSYYQPAEVAASFNAENDGTYQLALELSVRASFEFDPGKCRAIFKVDGRELLNKEFAWEDNKTFPPFKFEEKWQPGAHQMSFELQPLTPEDQKINSVELRIDSLAIQGPMEEKYWSRPKNYDRFFAGDAPQDDSGRRQYAREVLARFAQKAFRRPVDDQTLDRLVALAQGVYDQPGKTLQAGVGHAMVAVLSSPRFLFQTEEAEPASSSEAYPLVDEYSLASRLSYFLWSSMPDEELFALAAKGELRKNLPAQVKRMLADSRSEAMVDNFTGQWLQARDVEGITIDARAVLARDKGEEKQLKALIASFGLNKPEPAPQARPTNSSVTNALLAQAGLSAPTNAPGKPAQLAQAAPKPANLNPNNVNGRFAKPPIELNAELRHDMERETEMVFSTIVHEDRSILELIESDYTFLNQKLAAAYGLTNLGVTGTEMRRVTLPPDSPRGGVLTEGTVLVVTSNPDRTSPVKRGLFVLNNILGAAPPPPPPNVPALEAAEKDFHDHEPTLRETLTAHRDKPECASCHSRLDPVGLAFENFNALGLWRDQERSQTIEAAGRLISGETFQNVRELKHILATNHRDEFYRCLTEKMLTYATGRGMEYYDTETVDQIVQRLQAEDGRFSALLTGIIESAPFQKERRQANATLSDASQPSRSVTVNESN